MAAVAMRMIDGRMGGLPGQELEAGDVGEVEDEECPPRQAAGGVADEGGHAGAANNAQRAQLDALIYAYFLERLKE
jgi:hypothetical protein